MYQYSRTPLIRFLVIHIADHLGRLGISGKIFLTVNILYLFMAQISPHPQMSNTYKELCINVLFVRK